MTFQTKTTAPEIITRLIETFEQNLDSYRSSKNETELRREFLDKFLTALGWDVANEKGYDEAGKEVIHEFSVEVARQGKEADDLIKFYNMQEPRSQNRWVIIEKNGKNKIDTCGFHLWDKERNEVEIGFELMEKHNGNGFMTEAVEAIIEFAKIQMGVETIKAFVYVENDKCKRLVERFGFKKIDKEECIFRGEIYLHDIYEKNLNG